MRRTDQTTNEKDLARSGELDAHPSPQHAAENQKAATFTPGPWKIEPRHKDGLFVSGADAIHSVVCQIREYPDALTESNANARLIASAPDLLAALKALVEAGEFAVESDNDVAIMLRLGVATDYARAAIAKAEGR